MIRTARKVLSSAVFIHLNSRLRKNMIMFRQQSRNTVSSILSCLIMIIRIGDFFAIAIGLVSISLMLMAIYVMIISGRVLMIRRRKKYRICLVKQGFFE